MLGAPDVGENPSVPIFRRSLLLSFGHSQTLSFLLFIITIYF